MATSREYTVRISIALDDSKLMHGLKDVMAGFKEIEKSVQSVERRSHNAFERMAVESMRAYSRIPSHVHAQMDMIAREHARASQASQQAFQQSAAREIRITEELAKAMRRVREAGVKDLFRTSREQVHIAETTARDSARSYEKHLSPGFFRRLAGDAAKAFQGNFSIGGMGGSGGGASGILGTAVGVATGGLLTSVLGGVASKITGGVGAGFDFNRQRENVLLGLEVKLKGREEALNFFREVSEFAERSPLEQTGALDLSQKLLALRFSAREVIPTLRAVTDAVAGMGKVGGEASEMTGGVILALGQMRLKQKVSFEEMNQLIERGVNAWGYLANEIGRTDKRFATLTDEQRIAKVQELAQRGMLDANAAVGIIIRGMGEEYKGLGERIAKETLDGIESNTKDRLERLAGTATASAFARYKIARQQFLELLNNEGGDRLAGGISSLTGDVFNAMDSALGALKSGNLKQLGLAAAESAASGVRVGAQSLYSSGVEAASQLEQGIRDRLIMRSPSQVMLDLGYNAGLSFNQGFALGLQDKSQPGGIRRFTEEQIENARKVLEVGRRVGATEKQIRAAMSAIVVESNARNLNYGDRDSLGIFQQRPSQGWGTPEQVQNVFYAATKFFEAVMRVSQEGTVGQLAQRVQRSAFRERYDQRLADADRLLAAVRGGEMPSLAERGTTLRQPDTFGPFAPFRTAEEKDVAQSILHTLDVLNKEREQVQGAYRAAIDAAQSPERYAEATRLQRMKIASPSIVSDVQALTRDLGAALARLDEQILAAHDRLDDVLNVRGGDGAAARPFEGVRFDATLGPFSGMDISQEQARHVLDIFQRARDAQQTVSTETVQLATTITPRALESIRRPALEAANAFENLPPLIKQSSDAAKEMEERIDSVAKSVAGSFGNAFEAMFRSPREALKGLRQDFLSTLLGMGRDLFQSAIYKVLTGNKSTTGNASEGGFLNLLVGGAKNLFGIGRNTNSVLTGGFAGGPSPAANVVTGSGVTGPTSQQLSAAIKSGALATAYALGGPGHAFLGSNGGITAPQSLTRAEQMARDISRGVGGANTGTGAAAASAAAQALTWGALFKGFGFGLKPGTGGNLSGIAPLLGLQLGVGLGGQSRYGQLLGGAGGLLLGAGITAAPSFLAGSFLAPLFSNPITAIAGGALLVGSLILSKNKQRRSDEQTRNQLMIDSEAQLREILRQVQTNRLDGEQGIAQAMQVRAQYEQVAGSLRDAKTRRIALADIYRVDAHVTAIRRAAEQQVKNQQTAQRLIPEFQHGGIVGQLSSRQMREVLSMPRIHDNALEVIKVRAGERVIPPQEQARLLRYGGIIQGADRGVDDVYMQATRGTIILNKQHQREIPQFQEGGVVGGGPLPRPSLESRLKGVECYVTVNNYGDSAEAFIEFLDSETGKSLIVKGMKSADGRKATLGTMKTMRRNKEW